MKSRPLSSARSALLEARARQMRLQPTLSELRLWQALAGSQLGVAFRRQAVVGECIVDFLAPACRLVVEVDGMYHARRLRADARRDRKLERLGYRIIHLQAEAVLKSLSDAVAVIAAELASMRTVQ